jgi:signal transduction histidine kinase
MRKPSALEVDRATAVVLTATLELETWLGGNAHGHRLALAVGGPLFTLGVAVRRRFPAEIGLAAVLGSVLMQTLWPSEVLSFAIAWLCELYAFAVWTEIRTFALGMAAYDVAALATTGFGPALLFPLISTVAAVIVRIVVRDRDLRTQVAERERDVAAREAVVEERARIARELHDVIAHNVSMMVVQAGAERRVQEDPQARDVLETIEQIGRGALTETRRLVGMLREDGVDPLSPQPGLGDVATLVAQVGEAGLPVELRVEGEPRALPTGIELSAYRIVQEALTNALKHAGGAPATVCVRYGADALELEILDDGAAGEASAPGGGHGLAGMRERVALYGGRLEAGRRPAGGFCVSVLLPIR